MTEAAMRPRAHVGVNRSRCDDALNELTLLLHARGRVICTIGRACALLLP
jgi:hypothetical protein